MRRFISTSIGLVLVGLAMSGCGGDPQAERKHQTQQAVRQGSELIRDFYRGLNRHAFVTSWGILGGHTPNWVGIGQFRKFNRDAYYQPDWTPYVWRASPRTLVATTKVFVNWQGPGYEDGCGEYASRWEIHRWTLDKSGDVEGTSASQWRGDYKVDDVGGMNLSTLTEGCYSPSVGSTFDYSSYTPSYWDTYYPDYSDPTIENPYDSDCGDYGVGSDFPVYGSDPNGYDQDGDGIGCESP
jgi:hypothetical protein